MKKLCIFILALVATMSAFAAGTKVGDLYYDLWDSDLTATVRYNTMTDANYNYLTTVTIPAKITYNNKTYTVTAIGEYAFRNASTITSVVIGDSVKVISNRVFENCTKMTSVRVGTGVKTFGNQVFKGCTALKSVEWNAIHCNDFAFDQSPFHYNGDISDYNFDIRSQITSFTFGNKVEYLPTHCCLEMTNLKSVTLPATLQSISRQAFQWSGLTSVTIPDNVTSIEKAAFYGCTKLESVTLGAKVQSLKMNAFGLCENLSSIVWGNALTTIDQQAFWRCGFTSVAIPNTVTSVDYFAFCDCKNLTIARIGTSVKKIRHKVFSGCDALTTIYWDAIDCQDFEKNNTPFYYYEEGGSSNFDLRKQITAIHFGNAVEHIPAYLCDSLTSLTSVAIPASVKSIGYWSFNNCTGLTRVDITDLTAWMNINYLEGGDFIAKNPLFYAHSLYLNGTKLQELVVPGGITEIKKYAFQNCDLTKVTIPEEVTTIGYHAFWGCSKLAEIIDYATTPQYIYSSFTGNEAYPAVDKLTCKLYVPKASINLYREDEEWNEFANILPIEGEEGIDQPTSDSSLKGRGEKVLREGQLFIERNGKTFNLTGTELK